MKQNRTFGSVLFLFLTSMLMGTSYASPQSKPTIQQPNSKPTTKPALNAGAELRKRVVEYRLKNGMVFLLVQRKNAPTFTGYIRVKAGGVDEQVGYTGLAHIFEHMAFKGTTVIGSRNWKKEQQYLSQIYQLGEALSKALHDSNHKPNQVTKLLRRKLSKLQKLHQRFVNKDEFTRIYQANGGMGLNATTDKDLTSYFIRLPANRLELWAKMEASRLASPVFREFYKERDVVVEERRMAMGKGTSRLYEQFIATAFLAHPYRFPTVGWMSDITTIPLVKLQEFFKAYYNPGNMVGTLVGDINIEKTKKLLDETFGRIPVGSAPPKPRTQEPKQKGERRIKVRFHTHSEILIGYHKPTAPHFHDDVFDVIQALLTDGPDSRLHIALVKKRIAGGIWASSLPGSRFPNVFTLGAKPIHPHTTGEIESIIYKELERLKKKLVSAKELQKIRNKLSMDFLRSLRSNRGLAAQLSYFQAVTGDWAYITRQKERLLKVSPQAIMKVAKLYFKSQNRTVATLLKTKKKKRRISRGIGSFKKLLLKYKKQAKSKKERATTRRAKNKKARATTRRAKNKKAKATTQQAKQKLAKVIAKAKSYLSSQTLKPVLRPLPKGLEQHPSQIKFPKLQFKSSKPTIHRLANGMLIYLLEDHELPLIDVYVLTKTGRVHDPIEKLGLGEVTGKVMRTGGFAKVNVDKLDQELAYRGIRLTNEIGNEMGSASLYLHKKDFDWGIKHLFDMLRKPRFNKEQIKVQKSRMLEAYRRRNDSPFRLAINVFRRLVYGKESRWARYPTPPSIQKITRQDVIAFHKKSYHPNRMRLAIVGSFHSPTILRKIKTLTKDWKPVDVVLPLPKALPKKTKPQVALVRRQLPQSLVFVGHMGPRRHAPQLLAGKIMNHILGGGSFTSRLMREIRSNRGLAYFAGSQLFEGRDRGLFVAYTGTQPKNTGKALQTILDILKKIHKKVDVSKAELQLAQKTFLNRFIFNFSSAAQIVYQRAYYDYLGYPKNYLENYRSNLLKLTTEDMKKAVKTFIDPSQFVILVVGWDPGFDIPLSKFGKVQKIKLK